MTRSTCLGVLMVVALSAACDVTVEEPGDSGKQASSAGGNAPRSDSEGQEAASGGASGGATSSGGVNGYDGMAGAPSCACFSESTFTVELPAGPRVYDLVAEHFDGCNPLACEPDGPYAAPSGAPPSRYAMRGCRAEGDCAQIVTGVVHLPGTEGRLEILAGDELVLDEPIAITATLEDADRHQVIDFSFATTSEASIVASGSGSVCMASSSYLCLR